MKILIAKDEAFNFMYRANVDALRALGSVEFFSPLHDAELPSCDLLYLPGGYPELFIDALASNDSMRQQIKSFAEKGGNIFAECGGFMYLCKELDGQPMCDVLPLTATMAGAHLHLGYRQMVWNGHLFKGHEFHYSSISDDSGLSDAVNVLVLQASAKGRKVDTPIYRYRNVIAGYTHWYWADKTKDELLELFQMESLKKSDE